MMSVPEFVCHNYRYFCSQSNLFQFNLLATHHRCCSRRVVESENCFHSEITVGVKNLDVGRLQIIVVVKRSRLVFVLSQSF